MIKSIILVSISSSKNEITLFLLVSGRFVGAHPDGQQHGVSKESSKKRFHSRC